MGFSVLMLSPLPLLLFAGVELMVMPMMVDRRDLPGAVSLNSAIMTGSRVVGPAAAGGLVLWVGYGWPFIIDALTYVFQPVRLLDM